jgi:hypothetical protein
MQAAMQGKKRENGPECEKLFEQGNGRVAKPESEFG